MLGVLRAELAVLVEHQLLAVFFQKLGYIIYAFVVMKAHGGGVKYAYGFFFILGAGSFYYSAQGVHARNVQIVISLNGAAVVFLQPFKGIVLLYDGWGGRILGRKRSVGLV